MDIQNCPTPIVPMSSFKFVSSFWQCMREKCKNVLPLKNISTVGHPGPVKQIYYCCVCYSPAINKPIHLISSDMWLMKTGVCVICSHNCPSFYLENFIQPFLLHGTTILDNNCHIKSFFASLISWMMSSWITVHSPMTSRLDFQGNTQRHSTTMLNVIS